MKRQLNFEDILTTIQELDYLLKNIKPLIYNEEIHLQAVRLDLDIAKEKTRFIYDKLLGLTSDMAEVVKQQEAEIESVVSEIIPQKSEKIETKIPETKISETVIAEPLIEFIAEDILVEEKIKEPLEVDKSALNEITIIEEIPTPTIEKKTESIVDVIAKQSKGEDFASRLQQKSISDINDAIGLGEKLLFINELFGKDPVRYVDTIKELNSYSSLDDAIAYINANFSWNYEKESTNSFLDIVKRKFITA